MDLHSGICIATAISTMKQMVGITPMELMITEAGIVAGKVRLTTRISISSATGSVRTP